MTSSLGSDKVRNMNPTIMISDITAETDPVDVVEQVLAYLYRPGGKRSVEANGACRYLDSYGNRCAVGCLLTEDQCRESESTNADTVFARYNHNDMPDDRFDDWQQLLMVLQTIHDRGSNWDDNGFAPLNDVHEELLRASAFYARFFYASVLGSAKGT